MAGIQMHCQVLLPIKLNCTKTRENTMAFLNPFNLTEKTLTAKHLLRKVGRVLDGTNPHTYVGILVRHWILKACHKVRHRYEEYHDDHIQDQELCHRNICSLWAKLSGQIGIRDISSLLDLLYGQF